MTDVERIVMRDAKSYCAILFDDNNRKPISRLYFNKKKLAIGIFIGKDEQRFDIEKLSEIYKHKALILQSIQQYVAP
jgi:predicted type IV restriction endonuclease